MNTSNKTVLTMEDSVASREKSLPVLDYETVSPLRKFARDLFVSPLINYIIPTDFLVKILKTSHSELAHESLSRPGGWRSMMLAYANQKPLDMIDALVIKYGTFPMGLRNRKRMVVRKLVELIDYYLTKDGEANIVGVGAGTGVNTIEAIAYRRGSKVKAHLFDLAEDAFVKGEELKRHHDVEEHVHFIKADVAHLDKYLSIRPHIVKLIGIIEYLPDENLHKLLDDVSPFLTPESTVVVNTLEDAHNIDRFLKRVFNLNFYYRSPARLVEILKRHGYSDFRHEYEPLRVYSLLTAHRR